MINLDSIKKHCTAKQFCECSEPFIKDEHDTHCTGCGFNINFKARAKIKGLDFNVPKNWIF